MRTLLVGFKEKNNPSERIVCALTPQPVLLTNSFAGLAREVVQLDPSAEAVYLFGVDTSLRASVRVECVAQMQGQSRRTRLPAEVLTDRLCGCGIRAALLIHVPPLRFLDETFFQGLRTVSLCDKTAFPEGKAVLFCLRQRGRRSVIESARHFNAVRRYAERQNPRQHLLPGVRVRINRPA